MKLCLPLALRGALYSVFALLAVCGTMTQAATYPNSFTIDQAEFTGDVYARPSGSSTLLDVGNLMSSQVIETPFTIYLTQDTTQKYDGGAWGIDLGSPGHDIGGPIITFKAADGVEGDILYTVQNTKYSSLSVVPNHGLVCAQQGTFVFDVNVLLQVNPTVPRDGNVSMQGFAVIDNGSLQFNKGAAVEANLVRKGEESMFYGAATASGMADETDGKASNIAGQDFTFNNFSFTAEEGNVDVFGLLANVSETSCTDEDYLAGNVDRVTISMAGDVVIDGGSNDTPSVSTNGTANFTGVQASEFGLVNIGNGLSVQNVSVEGGEGKGSILVGVRASTDGEVNIGGDVIIAGNSVTNGALYSVVADGGTVTFGETEGATCVVVGDMISSVGSLYERTNDGEPKGDLISGALPSLGWQVSEEALYEAGGCINATFSGENSSFTGVTHAGDVTAPLLNEGADYTVSEINLTFTDGAQWNAVSTNGVQECSVTSLEANNAHIFVGTTAADWVAGTGADELTTVEIDNLTGSGSTFYMNMNLDSGGHDQIVVNGSSAGEHSIVLQVTGSKAPSSISAPLVQQQGASDAKFGLAGGKVDIGASSYALKGNSNASGGMDFVLCKVGVSPTGEAVMSFGSPSAQTSLMLQNIADLRSRHGEIRDMAAPAPAPVPVVAGKGVAAGVAPVPLHVSRFYAQALAGHDLVPGFCGHDYRSDFYGARVGFTRKVSERWMVGAELNLVEGEQRLTRSAYRSTGESESFGLLLSGTWTDDKGSYCDIVFGFDRYDQELNTRMYNGTPVSGSYSSFSPVLSAEIGRKFSFGRDGSWFVEPQAQLVWYLAGGDDYTMSNGMLVERGSTQSLTGRLGAAVGKVHRLHNDDVIQWHVDAGLKHEFLDDPDIRINGDRYEAESLGTRVYYGVGADWWLTPRSKVYGSIQREKGADYTSELNARIGFGYSF